MTDLWLAVAHHLAVFSLVALFAVEFAILHRTIDTRALRALSGMDLWYGVLAAVVLIIGVCRVIFAAKGWAFYQHNPWFWAKMGAFLIVALLSIPPTIAFIRWSRANKGEGAPLPPDAAVKSVRRWMQVEAAFFVLIPVFAAAMARYSG